MQLPTDEAVVMVSSVAPIKAKIALLRGHQFQAPRAEAACAGCRALCRCSPARADDWSGLAIPAVPAAPATEAVEGIGSADDGGPRQPEAFQTVAYDPELATSTADRPAR